MLMRTSDQRADSANRFLRLLTIDDRILLGASLERVTIVPGMPLLNSGMPIEFMYFPETLIVSIRNDGSDRVGIETAVVGCEGLIGWSGLSDSGPAAQSAVADMRTGTALRIPMDEMRTACAASTTLLAAVMRFVEVVIGQMAQAIVSHLRDNVDRRVCRWLLMRHDRLSSDQLLVKHDDIGANLGMRRASVTDCLHILEGERLIRCHRGRIIVCNRVGLEHLAGDSYGGPEAYYRSLLGPFGGIGDGARAMPVQIAAAAA